MNDLSTQPQMQLEGFLDDLLFSHTITANIQSPDDFARLINGLYKIVEDKFKPQYMQSSQVEK